MATIYKRGNYWWISYKDKTGRRIQESTGHKSQETALCLKRYYSRLEKYCQLSGTPLEKSLMLSSFIDEYISVKKCRVSSSTVSRDKHAVLKFKSFTGDKPLNHITSSDIEKWYNSLLKDYPVSTANSILRHLKVFFNTAVRLEYLKFSPCILKPVRETETPVRVLTYDEVSVLMKYLPLSWYELVKTALATGARSGELCRLTVHDVNLSIPALVIKSTPDNPTKSKKSRLIPIPSHSLDLFHTLIKQSSDDYLLHNPMGTQWNIFQISKGFSRYASEAGINCTFHDLRRTYGAWLVMSGADLVTVKENMGHSDISVTIKYYSHLIMNHKLNQVNRLPVI